MASAVFVRVAAPQTKSSLWSKSSKNFWSMEKISLHVLSILKKHMTEFLGINFGRFCGNMALIFSCYSPLVIILPRRFVRVNGKQSKTFHVGVGFRKSAFFHLSVSLFIWIGLTNAAKLMSVSRLQLQNQSSAITWWFGSAFFHRMWPPARIK